MNEEKEEIKQETAVPKQPFEVVHVNVMDYIVKVMWPLIVEFYDATKIPGMSPQTIAAYLIKGIQYKTIEIWVGLENNIPIGFAVFHNMDFPYYSTGNFEFFYACKYKRELSDALTEKFLDFHRRHNLKYFGWSTGEEKLAKRFHERAKELGFSIKRESFVFMGKRKMGG